MSSSAAIDGRSASSLEPLSEAGSGQVDAEQVARRISHGT